MGDNGDLKGIKLTEPIILTIKLTPDGKVHVTGPIKDRIMCYGLLEMAKETIYDFNKNLQKINPIIPNRNNVMGLIK